MHKTSLLLHKAVRCAMLAALLCVVAPFAIPIGTVPVTLSVAVLMVIGYLCPPGEAVLTVGLYLCLGAVGLPVFSGGNSGLSSLLGPTGGFLFGYLPTVLLVSVLCRLIRRRVRTVLLPAFLCVLACILSLGVLYASGVLWFVRVLETEVSAALAVCVWPFLVPDILKCVFAVYLARRLRVIVL